MQFFVFYIFIFLSCTSPYTDKNNNNIEKDNSELTLKERAGKYIGKDHNYPTCDLELNIAEEGNLNIILTINSTKIRTIMSNIDASDKINSKELELTVTGIFKDSFHPDTSKSSEVTLQFLFAKEINMYFYYDGVLYGGLLKKYNIFY
ncbi:Uncharacterised protein [Brachyspira pilosicoli]|uniref:hypothetical protein n=1 Tax=Brachyspira pilosicoli TaxID=52584 RepID=UPI000E15EFD2|nr:hypothetical protein [Brachyspira pilosicoli]SUW21352.1 Uncharacterised protein [Brachyspira pilosicoli]